MHDSKSIPISCCIIALNEGDVIGRCIAAARAVADEIIVVDSGSTDDTAEKARALGARVIFHAFEGYGPQKRYAEEQAAHDWVLNLDADEFLTEALAGEIVALMRSPPTLSGYRFRQVLVYPGHEHPRLWADFHNYVRLYDRRAMRFRTSPVHDTVDTGGHAIGQLRGAALHHSWRSLAHLRAKFERYTDLQTKSLRKPRWQVLLRLPFEYPLNFARYYIARRNFTGGLMGVRVAHICAVVRTHRLMKFLR